MKKSKTAIDLYSGIGGWTLGLKLAGVSVLSSYEWWKDANRTHNKNFNTDYKEINIRTLELSQLPEPGSVDYVVGSPPCTQFSLANRGGKGDIADGLIDIYKFLEAVEYLGPKYWAMENVPRVANILEQQLQDGILQRFCYLFNDIKVFTASDFGVPQDRKRMIAGNLPFELLESYKSKTPRITLGEVISALNTDPVVDLIYGIQIDRNELTDHQLEVSLTDEERRINRETKSHHPVYNMMSFPDRLDRPSRTITAVCTRVSRESIIIDDEHGNLRRLTVRERGLLQSFPINYQYFGSSYNNKIKMIGNAVPPVLTFYIAQAMQEIRVEKVRLPHQVQDRLILGTEKAITSRPDNQGANYPWNRSFWMAIGGLRFGSGVRFDLKNVVDKDKRKIDWRIGFHYGNSKNMKAKRLDRQLLDKALELVEQYDKEPLTAALNEFQEHIRAVNSEDLQLHWTNQDRHVMGPIELIDQIASFKTYLKKTILDHIQDEGPIRSFVGFELKNKEGELDNKKLSEKAVDIFAGILLGTIFNAIMSGETIAFDRLVRTAV